MNCAASCVVPSWVVRLCKARGRFRDRLQGLSANHGHSGIAQHGFKGLHVDVRFREIEIVAMIALGRFSEELQGVAADRLGPADVGLR